MSAATRTLPIETQPEARPSTSVEARPEAPPSPSRAAIVLVLLVIFATFAARCWPSARYDAITSDETTHLLKIFSLLSRGDDIQMWELGAPRLPHVLGGAASYYALNSRGILATDASPIEITRTTLSGVPRVTVPARCVAIVWGIGLIGLVFWAVARLRGAALGLVAAAIVANTPECIAHSAIAGSDMPFTTSAFLTLVLLARYAEKPSPWRWLGVCLAVGLSWAMRHTALLLVPLAASVHLICSLRRPREKGLMPLADAVAGSGLASVAMGITAFAILWAGDGLGSVPLGEILGRTSAGTGKIGSLGGSALHRLPVPTSALSIIKQVRHQNQGHAAYLCGDYRQEGWPAYFPIAFLLKTPTGLISLMVLAIARFRTRRATWAWDGVAIAFLGLLWIMLVRNKVNIGVRYALLTYPIAATFVASMFTRDALRDRIWGPITVAATVWFVVASVSAHPRYLSSFNEIGGGPRSGWKYLADSNLDWGQDFDRLGETLQRRGIKDVTIDVSTERRLNVPGVFAVINPSRALQLPAETPLNRRLYDDEGGYIPVFTRYVAVSASRFLGLYSHNDMSWLRTRKLVERVGDSIFLFDLDAPADEPFGD